MPSDPTLLTIGDFNGDGKPDMAVYLFSSQISIAVLFGDGHGSFHLKNTFPAGVNSNTMVSGDFNGDGKADLALNSGTNIVVMLGNGDGTFRSPQIFPVPTGAAPYYMTVADVNGDGKPDLVTYGIGVGILLGNGDGTFRTGTAYLPNQSTGPGFVIGDWNGDGHSDLAVYSSGNAVILLGNGDGTFRQGVTYAVSGEWIAAADFNGDGKMDLAVDGNDLSILPGNGDGTFGSAALVGQICYVCTIQAGDFNGDGHPDLVLGLAGPISSIFVVSGNGDGTFQPAQQYSAGGEAVSSLAIADLNGDGIPDVVAAAELSFSAGVVSAFLGVHDAPLLHGPTFATGSNPISVATADFNGDGHADVVVANWNRSGPSGSLSILLGNGDGTLRAQTNVSTVPNPYFVVAGDFNHDGKPDLAVASYTSQPASGALYILLGNGDGTFQSPTSYAIGEANCIAIGDLDGDHELDLAVTSFGSPGKVSILRGKGDGTFFPHLSYAVGATATAVVIGDFNGDGAMDLAVSDSGNNVAWILTGYGDGTFKLGSGFGTGQGPVSLATTDFRGTGKSDLVAGTSLGISILLNDGQGNLLYPKQYALPSAATSVVVSDFNHDGELDVAAFGSGVALVLGKSYGEFTFEQSKFLADQFPAQQSTQAIAVSRLNADRKPDLVVANSWSNNVSILLNETR